MLNNAEPKKMVDKNSIVCPRCLEKMIMEVKRNVEIQRCPNCNMILLEKQDLDEIFKDYKSGFREDYVEKKR